MTASLPRAGEVEEDRLEDDDSLSGELERDESLSSSAIVRPCSLVVCLEDDESLSSSASVRSSMARPTDGRSMVSSPMER